MRGPEPSARRAPRQSRARGPGGAGPDGPGAPLDPGLYVVATPIGNLSDLSPRAHDVLARADLIAAEDTRVTAKLLTLVGLKRPIIAYNDHNGAARRPEILERLDQGQAIALVSDAGTPLISDPGYKLVADAAAAGHAVVPIPGPSALITALSVAGLPTDRVLFLGFLPAKAGARREALAEVAAIRASLVLFEAPHRLREALADLADVLGPRPAMIAREMTKLHEEIRRGSLDALAAAAAEAPDPKGEIVIVIAPPEAREEAPPADVDGALRAALGTMSLKDAVEAVARAHGLNKRAVYARALAIADRRS